MQPPVQGLNDCWKTNKELLYLLVASSHIVSQHRILSQTFLPLLVCGSDDSLLKLLVIVPKVLQNVFTFDTNQSIAHFDPGPDM